jgi:hypothetical protein
MPNHCAVTSEQYAALPDELTLREVRVRVTQRGFRPKQEGQDDRHGDRFDRLPPAPVGWFVLLKVLGLILAGGGGFRHGG